MIKWCPVWLIAIVLVCLLRTQIISSASSSSSSNSNISPRYSGNDRSSLSGKEENCTELARDDETLLVFSTLGGGLTAVDPITSEIRWSIEDDEPAISVPTEGYANPQYLPDPRDGSLYQLGNRGGLKKLPYTIPQLVASAPCRSSDGILYSGKKADTWYLIDPKTGRREKVLDFGGNPHEKIGWATSRALYLGRTQYTVLMYDSMSPKKDTKPWNVTFFDYSAHTMTPEVSKEYEYLHLTASASGMTVTLDRQSGTFKWLKQLESPVVATFLMGPDGLLSVPFTTVSDETLTNIVEFARDGQKNDIKLFQTLYVGEHPNGLYAIPSLADRNIAQIPADAPPNLIDGPPHGRHNIDLNSGYLSTLLEGAADGAAATGDDENVLLLGHYQMPQVRTDLKLTGALVPKLGAGGVGGGGGHDLATVHGADLGFEVININRNSGDQAVIMPPDSNADLPRKTYANRTVPLSSRFKLRSLYSKSRLWLNDQESKILKLLLIILMGMIVAMFWYMRHTVRELRQSQTGSSRAELEKTGSSGGTRAIGGAVRGPIGTSYQELIDLGDGEVRVGKIIFNTAHVLGKGCEGTFVFRGSFEKRQVAVKRLLPECFTLADREVALLRESDAHENVVRYFCTEQDRQFRYIAVELCAATLQDYIESGVGGELQRSVPVLDVLRQATNGLMHLHSLSIVHRDIKPQNVLLSLPGVRGQVRAMISDFGLCKKMDTGKTSFSRRSGVTGTEGWIAPEMLKGQRTTTAVDIFSLGCVYYYVLSNGKHPFGEAVRRQANILAYEHDLAAFRTPAAAHPESSKILAEQLVAAMISKDPQRRPPAAAALNHPFFWSEERVLAFLQDVSDRVEKLDYSQSPLRTLERNGRLIVRDDWSVHLHESIRADLRKYRGYFGNSVRDLMRALRNKKHHYHELSEDMQSILGQIPRDFTRYWVQRFPHLLAHAFHALESCSKESALREYYTEGFTFARSEYFALPYEEFVPVESAPRVGKETPAGRKYSKDLRQRVIGGAAAAASAASADAELAEGASPRPMRRSNYGWQRNEGGGGGVATPAAAVEPTNWRKKKEPAQTPAWTMPGPL